MRSYPLFKYVVKDSKIHKMSSETKVLSFLLLLASCILSFDYISSALISLILIIIMVLSKVSLKDYLKNVSALFGLYVVVFLIALLVSFNPLISLLISIKSIFIILLLLTLVFTTSLSEIAWGFESLFKGLKKIKIPVSNISLKIALFLKMISVLFDKIRSVKKSMAYRGINNRRGIIYNFNNVFIPALTLSFRHVINIKNAMRLRFYGSKKMRTNYHEYKKGKMDKYIIILLILLLYLTIDLGFFVKGFRIFG